MSGLVWEDPPPRDTGHGKPGHIAAVARQLKARPNHWARISAHDTSGRASSAATHLRRRYGLQTATRKIGDQVVVYARYASDGPVFQ